MFVFVFVFVCNGNGMNKAKEKLVRPNKCNSFEINDQFKYWSVETIFIVCFLLMNNWNSTGTLCWSKNKFDFLVLFNLVIFMVILIFCSRRSAVIQSFSFLSNVGFQFGNHSIRENTSLSKQRWSPLLVTYSFLSSFSLGFHWSWI